MSDDTRRSELALLTLTERQQHRAAVSVAAYALRATCCNVEARELTAVLLDQLGLNGRGIRLNTGKGGYVVRP